MASAVNIVVSTNSDAVGVNGSLRQAIQFNAFLGGGNTILFSNIVTGTISLAQGELLIDRDVTIIGPGAKVLAINGNRVTRIFHITNNVAVNLSGLTITNGVSAAGGGGILGDNGSATLSVSDCAISGNVSTGSGGGINRLSGVTTLLNCLISSNSASVAGGGITGSGVTMTNCTVTGNTSGSGGGIYAGGDVRMVHCTVSGNTTAAGANSGGGVFRNAGTVTIGNTILAGNTAATGPDCSGAFNSGGYNVIGSTSGSTGFGTIGDQLNVNPLLSPLRDLRADHARQPGYR